MKANKSEQKSKLQSDIPENNATPDLDLAFIISTLKQYATKKNPVSAAEIAKQLSKVVENVPSEKSILRKLRSVYNFQENQNNSPMEITLMLSLGGKLILAQGRTDIKKQNKFYFEPLLDAGDLSMICGAITSNHYLSEIEKEYLLSREYSLSTQYHKQSVNELALQNILNKPDFAHSDSGKLLHNINLLYQAIEEKYQITVTYGIYDFDKNNNAPALRIKNPKKSYTLNPYALLWNNGQYYLLATHSNHTNPVHFRVDRIVEIQPVRNADDAREYVKRENTPDLLSPYFSKTRNAAYSFNAQMYTKTYPLMGIYDTDNRINCRIECSATSLSILIDAFGKSVRIHNSLLTHAIDEVDLHGNSQTFYTVTLIDVQYDNILQFCQQYHTTLTVLSPEKLKNEICDSLIKSLNRYSKYKLPIM